MNSQFLITDIKQITPTWLSGVLNMSGYLPSGEIVKLQAETWKQTNLSVLVRVRATYSLDMSPLLPEKFLLKYTKPDLTSNKARIRSKSEFDFYSLVASKMLKSPVPICYDSYYSSELGKTHLLLDDLSETHIQAQYPLYPTVQQCEQNIDTLAQFHMHWWNNPNLGYTLGRKPSDQKLESRFQALKSQYDEFSKYLGDRLSDERRTIYQNALSRYIDIVRSHRDNNITIIHGDTHNGNFMNPVNPEKDRTRIIDWEFWNIDSPTYDLAFMIAVHWYPEQRDRLEEYLVRRYHNTLLSFGIDNYSWKHLWNDYKLSVIRHLFTPIMQWHSGVPAQVWWHNLERVMMTFQSLKCNTLI